MASSNAAARPTRRVFVLGIFVALAVAWATAAGGEGRRVSGEAFLEAKDGQQMTLQLEDEVAIRVVEDTRIYDGDEKRISFEMIPDPASAQIVVEYSGEAVGRGAVVARRLVVKRLPN